MTRRLASTSWLLLATALGCAEPSGVARDTASLEAPQAEGASLAPGAPQATPLSPLMQTAVAALARELACRSFGGGPRDALDSLPNLDGFSEVAKQHLACQAAASSCEAFEACDADVGVPVSCPGEQRQKCDGNALVSCDGEGGGRRFECSDMSPDNPLCVSSSDDPDNFGCAAATGCSGIGSCSGDVVQLCMDGLVLGHNCRASGGTCVTEGGFPGCGASCTVERCDGTVAVTCGLDSALGLISVRSRRQNCADFGSDFTCSLDSGGKARCRPRSASCDLGPTGGCDGETAWTCWNGAVLRFDCGAVADAQCQDTGDEATCAGGGDDSFRFPAPGSSSSSSRDAQ